MGFALSDMQVSSGAFGSLAPIPKRHTGEGENVSPPLAWSDPPAGAKAFAVICHDPDAPLVKPGAYGYVHWVLYNLDGSLASVDPATPVGTAGVNDSGKAGYTGPMPPPGHGRHHYYFWVLALDRQLDLPPGLSMWEFLAKAEAHVIGMNRIVGTYERG
ncbi:MAG: YbhB/YbcL family Raf kinase inhibitor-like protein [Spirochaetaceae bacterium]|nr:MAG: YbhB/YbcL family Raf kinase inhibitor-like protein [Spirochaetaceae bacterium]